MMTHKPHYSHIEHDTLDRIRMTVQDDGDTETAIEMLFEVFPDATRDEVVDVLEQIEQIGEGS